MSEDGTFETWRDAWLESVTRATADMIPAASNVSLLCHEIAIGLSSGLAFLLAIKCSAEN
jgi:hypothetical protein